MRVEVTLEQDGKLLDRFEFEHRRGDDLISGFAAATTRFRRNHPELSLSDAGVSIRLAKATQSGSVGAPADPA
jgi:hypothetical protein